jgi:hypothetical protein
MNVVHAAVCREKGEVFNMTVSISKRPADAPAPDTSSKSGAAKSSVSISKGGAKPGGPTKKPARNPKKAPAVRAGTKTAKILSLLQRPGGASLTELRKATGWQPHSVRGFLSGALKKKMGLRVHSTKRESGERVYRVAAK